MYLWCGCTVVADHFKQLSEPHDGTEVAKLLYGGVRCIYGAGSRVLVYLWWQMGYLWSLHCSTVSAVYLWSKCEGARTARVSMVVVDHFKQLSEPHDSAQVTGDG